MSRNLSALQIVAALAIMLMPWPSFAVTITGSNNAGCAGAFFQYFDPVSFPILEGGPPCTQVGEIQGNIETATDQVLSRFEHDSFGAYFDFGIELDASNGNGISVTPPSGGWAQMRDRISQQITVSGGSGEGVLRMGLDVHGVADLSDFLPGSSFFLALSIDSTVDDFQSTIILGDFLLSDVLDIPFTYGSPFPLNLDFILALNGPPAGARPGERAGPYRATIDFLDSGADFSFSVFDDQLRPVAGSTVTSDDGFVFTQPGVITVPEPSTLALFGAGLWGFGALRRRKNKP